MAFANQQNDDKKQVNVNSDGYQFMCRESKLLGLGSTMIISLWNSLVTIKMYPAKPEREQTQKSVYDYNKNIAVYLKPEIALGIAEDVANLYQDAIARGTEFHKAYQVSMKGDMLAFAYAPVDNGGFEAICTIMKSVNAQNFQPEASISYSFNLMPAVIGFSGVKLEDNYRVEYLDEELSFFLAALKHMALGQLGAENHGRKLKDHTFNHEVYMLYKALAEKLGVTWYNRPAGSAAGFSSKSRGFINMPQQAVPPSNYKSAFDSEESMSNFNNEVTQVSLDELVDQL